MASIGVLANLSDAVEQFKKIAERAEKTKLNIKIYWYILCLILKSRILLKDFRAIMRLCDELCPEAACMQKYYPKIKHIRDQYAAIYQVALHSWRLAPLRYLLDKTLDDWNDLTEDTAIASDTEIRGLITKISDAL
jgi:hypothetical protein